MFGLKDPKQIYHEELFQLALKNNIGGKIGEISNNVLDCLSKIWDKVGQAKEVVQSIATVSYTHLPLQEQLLAYSQTRIAVIRLEHLQQMRMVRPVSYTHLDVYKRQSLHLSYRTIRHWRGSSMVR